MQEKGFDLTGRRIFIGLPSYDHKVSVKHAISLMRFGQDALRHGITVQVGSLCGCSVVSKARNHIIADFLKSDCTELMFIDSDINFEPEAVLRIMAFGGAMPKPSIIGAVPRTRSETLKYVATPLQHDDGSLRMNGFGLLATERLATAFMWISREIIEDLINNHPEWKYREDQTGEDRYALFDFLVENGQYLGEDYLFCDRARARGYEIWVDPTITLGHMGVQEYMGNFGKDYLEPMVTSLEQVEV